MMAKYAVIHNRLRGGMTRREGEVEVSPQSDIWGVLENIFYIEQNEITPRDAPSANSGDLIQVTGRTFRIDNYGFTELTEDEVKAHLGKDIHQIMKEQLKIDQEKENGTLKMLNLIGEHQATYPCMPGR